MIWLKFYFNAMHAVCMFEHHFILPAIVKNWVIGFRTEYRLYDDGTHGDKAADDNIWTIEIELPAGAVVEYKFTNSGAEGSWNPGEEFPGVNRKIKVEKNDSGIMILLDKFGKI